MPEPAPQLRLLADPAASAALLEELQGIRQLLRVLVQRTPKRNKSIDLSAVEQAVLRCATDVPQTAKKLARLAGYSEGRVREACARLTDGKRPLLIRVNGGLRLPLGKVK